MHASRLNLITVIILVEVYKLLTSLYVIITLRIIIVYILPLFLSLHPSVLLSIFLLDALNLRCLTMRDQILHPYKITDRIHLNL
jgi:hypothetical protein